MSKKSIRAGKLVIVSTSKKEISKSRSASKQPRRRSTSAKQKCILSEGDEAKSGSKKRKAYKERKKEVRISVTDDGGDSSRRALDDSNIIRVNIRKNKLKPSNSYLDTEKDEELEEARETIKK